MNADRLLAHYERIADAPDAITRLRRFILDLAVRGKLVEQDPNDVSPEKCLLAAQKRLQEQAKKTKRLRRIPSVPIMREEVQKCIPNGWLPARLNDTGLYINGLAFKPSDWKQAGLPIIRIQNLTDPSREFNYASGEFPDEVIVRDGDILVSWSATLEAFTWSRGKAVLNQHIFRVLPDEKLTAKSFLHLVLRHAVQDMADGKHAHGLVMTHINRGPFLAHIVLIPPLAEQHRIVAKVDELMALCDRLEAARAEQEATRDRLSAASLARLNAPDPNPSVFKGHAVFALKNFAPLTTRLDQIKALRQTILNLAVRGKLVKQDRADEPASELLKRLKEEKRLVRQKQTEKTRALHTIDPRGAPFDLPKGWSWATFPELGVFGRGKSKYRPRNDPVLFVDGTFPMVQTGDVARSKGVISTYTNKYNETGLAQSMLWPKGTLCITIAANIADSGILSFDACFPDSVVGLVPSSMFQNSRYFEYFMRTAKTNLLVFAPSTAQKNINLGILETLLIPLPPLAEQQLIVAKVDELMAFCDRLEVDLGAADTTRHRLLESLLQDALEPAAGVLEAAK